jgi:hypothetical protein
MTLLALVYVLIIEAERKNSVTTNEALSVVRAEFLLESLLSFWSFVFQTVQYQDNSSTYVL